MKYDFYIVKLLKDELEVMNMPPPIVAANPIKVQFYTNSN
jgi:hypothetical protein